MPAPRLIGTKKIWDRVELDEALEELPRQLKRVQSMPSSRIKHFNQFVDRHGKERIQYREPGQKKVTLRAPVGSQKFC